MDEGRSQYQESLQLSASAMSGMAQGWHFASPTPPRAPAAAAPQHASRVPTSLRASGFARALAFALATVLACLSLALPPSPASAQQRSEKYAGYSPSARADDVRKKSALKKSSKRKAEAKAKSSRQAKARAEARRDLSAKKRVSSRKAVAAKVKSTRSVSTQRRARQAAAPTSVNRKASVSRKTPSAAVTARAARSQPSRAANREASQRRTQSTNRLAAEAKAPLLAGPATGKAGNITARITPPVPATPAKALPVTPNPPRSVTTRPASAPVAADTATASAAAGSSGFSTWIGLPLLAGALGAFLYFRRRPEDNAFQDAKPHIDPTLELPAVDVAVASQQVKADLMQRAEPFFVDLRNASVRKDHEFILQHCTEDMATSLILDSEIAELPVEPRVEGLRAELVDLFEEVNRYVASVQYTADEQLGDRRPRRVNEVWHFVREPDGPDWRLAAVESA